ncbi:MAG: hypothetical protein H0T53_12795, partial [Herpetosiphonaceae bacterium]|nr:hypothetical protein [Herpetosiphonaceae bacterium]
MLHPNPVHPPQVAALGRGGLILMVVLSLVLWQARPVAALGTDIVGPLGSDEFGKAVIVLPNGNLVVTDPSYDQGATPNVGAVYLYNGTTLALISTLVGTQAEDQVGYYGALVLANGNYVIRSPFWRNGSAIKAGAVTWGSATTGVAGTINLTNSLVGSSAEDGVGLQVSVLPNGSYLALTLLWDNGANTDAGAVTWGSGTTGVTGIINAANSLVGATANDLVGGSGVKVLPNGNYLVQSPDWNNGGVTDAGAVTWGSANSGVAGVVSATNSLVGSSTGDRVGVAAVRVLSNDNYIIISPGWDNGTATDAGAVTWGSATTGVVGAINATNSLVGSSANDGVGLPFILPNGNYIIASSGWDNGAAADVGAVTWGSGAAGVKGVISPTNSLVGSSAGDRVGNNYPGVTVLSNSNYVVSSWTWDSKFVSDAGAITWGSGTTGITGVINLSNSLIGSTTEDILPSGITELTNGNYVVNSPFWDNGTTQNVGAVTWGSGATGVVGTINSTTSLVGTSADDTVGRLGVRALANGNYVTSSPDWNNGGVTDAGAVTWGSGAAGLVGPVTPLNSLVGSTAADYVGISPSVTTLANGNYLVSSPLWDNGGVTDTGALTWGSGATGVVGPVTPLNSLVGSTAADQVGGGAVTELTNGNYVVNSPFW